MERDARYCTTEDGVRIAYTIEGKGYPLLWCPLAFESFSLTDEMQAFKGLMSELVQRWSVVRYDPRGVGLSDRDAAEQSSQSLVLDVAAVVDASGFERIAIWGNIMSGPRAIQYAATHPDRVSHLVLYDTFANPHEAFPQAAGLALADVARADWRLASQTLADMGTRSLTSTISDAQARQRIADFTADLGRLYERSASGVVAASMIEEAYDTWDVHTVTADVRCPTLVVHHLSNPLFPIDAGRGIAASIPDATFAAKEGTWATPITEYLMGGDVVTQIERFLPSESGQLTEAHGPFRTVLFTDLVGHTEMMSRLGDEKGREVLREHERITREVLAAHGGTEIKTMGDGFMASFGSVTKAVECAIALQQAFAKREGEPLSVRVGLNAGEPIEEEGDLFGATVILASRIAAKAEGGEILVANAVRELCTGKGFMFNDRGEFVAKGFEEPVRVYEVSWQH